MKIVKNNMYNKLEGQLLIIQAMIYFNRQDSDEKMKKNTLNFSS